MLKEVLESLNPGRALIETGVCPHARTLRTDFRGKLQDAFLVLFGNDKGIFSYLLGGSNDSDPEHAR